MASGKRKSGGVTRRDFVKSAAVVGLGAAALSMGIPAKAESRAQARPSVETPRSVAAVGDLPTRTQPTVIPVETGGQALVEAAAAYGLNYWFINAGTDWPAIIDAVAKRSAAGNNTLQLMPVPHEVTAAHMGMGYAAVSGKVPVVGLHVTVGPANSHAAIANIYSARLPVIFIGGRRSWTEEGFATQFGGWSSSRGPIGQESRDQGGLVREYVKYDYEFRTVDTIPDVLRRAYEAALSDPQGPVYLMLPVEVGDMPATSKSVTVKPQELFTPAAPSQGDPASIAQAVNLLANASNPLIITSALGKDPTAVDVLVNLAELLAIPVSGATGQFLNFPKDHPLSASIPLSKADVIFTIESPNPWSTISGIIPNQNAKYIDLGVDPLNLYPYPFASHYPADVRIAANPKMALTEMYYQAYWYLIENPSLGATIKARFAATKAIHDAAVQAAIKDAQSHANDSPIDSSYLGYCLSQVVDENTIYINELGPPTTTINFTKPGSYFGDAPFASLGRGLGMALGAKLGALDKTVILGVGDGSYIYGVPTAAYFTSQKYKLPFLTVIDTNTCWRAVKNALTSAYPKGYAVNNNLTDIGSSLAPAMNYEMVCQAAGGYGQKVVNSADIPGAIAAALDAVRSRKVAACLNVITKHP